MIKARLQTDGLDQPVDIRLEAIDPARPGDYVATVADVWHQVQVVRRGPHGGWLRIHGRITPFYSVRSDAGTDVWLNGRTYRVRSIERAAARRATAAGGSLPQEEIKAPMPGTILKINAAVGDTFAAHAPLIVMESMKMEMALSAPHAGRVREILCKVGELVPMGQVLARLDEEGADAAPAGQDR